MWRLNSCSARSLLCCWVSTGHGFPDRLPRDDDSWKRNGIRQIEPPERLDVQEAHRGTNHRTLQWFFTRVGQR